MTNLAHRPARQVLIERIQANGGFLSVRDYMGFCLHDPHYGYYRHANPLGREGDFITAPEISQIFGELLGLWIVSVWEYQDHPSPVSLIELGPGRGLLTRDMLRAIKIRPPLYDHLEVHHVEIHPDLRALQSQSALPKDVIHHQTIPQALEASRSRFTFVIANEFLDALPIDQYVFENDTWRTRGLGYDEKKDQFFFTTHDVEPPQLPVSFPFKPRSGTILESSPPVDDCMEAIFNHLNKYGGAGLFIDYGYDHFGYGDTLQAIKKHRKVDPLQDPCVSDLTAHVNFAHLLKMAQGESSLTAQVQNQGAFLTDMGILTRTQHLAQSTTDPRVQQALYDATQRLIAPDQMGDLFKVLQVWSV